MFISNFIKVQDFVKDLKCNNNYYSITLKNEINNYNYLFVFNNIFMDSLKKYNDYYIFIYDPDYNCIISYCTDISYLLLNHNYKCVLLSYENYMLHKLAT